MGGLRAALARAYGREFGMDQSAGQAVRVTELRAQVTGRKADTSRPAPE